MPKPKTTTTKYPGVFRTPTGWFLIATHVAPDGRQSKRRKTLPQCPVDEAVAARAALVAEMESPATGAPPPPQTPSRPTVSSYAVDWLLSKKPRLKASVGQHYESVVAGRIPPDLLSRPIDTLTRADADAWARWIEAQRKEDGEPFSTATLGSWWRPICTMLRDAAADHGFGDPTYRVRPPKGGIGRRRERRTLTERDLALLLATFERRFPAWATEVRVMMFSGLRAGELYALEWGDLDEEAGVIHVERAVWRGNVGTTKTDDPRDIALTPALRETLAAHRKRQTSTPGGTLPDPKDTLPDPRDTLPDPKDTLPNPKDTRGVKRDTRGAERDTRAIVFPAQGGGFRGASALYKRLGVAGEAAGLAVKVGPQVLRRTFNTLMLTAGVDRVVLRSQMGHSDEDMTEHYAHINAAMKRDAVGALEGRVRAKGTPEGTPEAEVGQ